MDGFICQITAEKIKIFSLSDGLVELPYKPDLALGDFIFLINEEKYEKLPKNFKIPHFKVFSDDEQVFVKLRVVGPNCLALPKELRKKYENFVWSPHLGLINDPVNLYAMDCRGDEIAEFVVKFNPTENSLFETVRLVPINGKIKEEYRAYMKMTPWFLEEMGTSFPPIYEQAPEDLASVNRNKGFDSDCASMGICIQHDFINSSYASSCPGSHEKCLLLWSPVTGLTRSIITKVRPVNENLMGLPVQRETDRFEGDPLSMLGKWFSYQFNDGRRSKEKQMKKKGLKVKLPPTSEESFNYVTATKLKEVKMRPSTQLRMEDGQYNFEIRCSFVFQHTNLESEANRNVKSWAARKKFLKRDAHFVDHELGKIEIYPHHSQFLIEKIENFRAQLKNSDPEKCERLKDETIIINCSVGRVRQFFENSFLYPKCGLFKVKKINKICFFNGHLIYESTDSMEEGISNMEI